jgi:predicted PhzF superfamily epimerase YddE/YHI9
VLKRVSAASSPWHGQSFVLELFARSHASSTAPVTARMWASLAGVADAAPDVATSAACAAGSRWCRHATSTRTLASTIAAKRRCECEIALTGFMRCAAPSSA